MMRDSKSHKRVIKTENQLDTFCQEIKELMTENEDFWTQTEEYHEVKEISSTTLNKKKAPHSNFSIQQLRKMIKEKGLHELLEKPINSCKKEELYKVIFA